MKIDDYPYRIVRRHIPIWGVRYKVEKLHKGWVFSTWKEYGYNPGYGHHTYAEAVQSLKDTIDTNLKNEQIIITYLDFQGDTVE